MMNWLRKAAAFGVLLAFATLAVADTSTTNLLLTNQTTGGNPNTWGDIADANFEIIDNKLGDTQLISTTGGDTTLTDNQERVAIIRVSGTLASDANIIFTGRGGFWIIDNDTTAGDYTLTAKLSGQTGVVITPGTSQVVYCCVSSDVALLQTEPDVVAEVTVASASTTDVLGAESSYVAISGTTTITSLGSTPNVRKFVRFTGATTLTYNGTSLILPGGANIKTAAGDTMIVASDASGNARVYSYQRASGFTVRSHEIGEIFDMMDDTCPAGSIEPYGQNISRTTYATFFAALGTSCGTGDGSTTFGVCDLRGRVRVSQDDMGGSSANRVLGTDTDGVGMNGDTLFAVGGEELTTDVADHDHTGSVSGGLTGSTNNDTHSHSISPSGNLIRDVSAKNAANGSGSPNFYNTDGDIASDTHNHSAGTLSFSDSFTTNNTGDASVTNMQPSIIVQSCVYTGVH